MHQRTNNNRELLQKRSDELEAEIQPLREKYGSLIGDPLQATQEISDQCTHLNDTLEEKKKALHAARSAINLLQNSTAPNEARDSLDENNMKIEVILHEIANINRELKKLASYQYKDHQRYLDLQFEIQSIKNQLTQTAAQSKAFEVRPYGKRHVITTVNLLVHFMQQKGAREEIATQLGFKPTKKTEPTDTEIVFAAAGKSQTIKLTEQAVFGDVHSVEDAKQIGPAMAAIFMHSTAGRTLHHVAIEKSDSTCSDQAIAELERIYAQAFVDNNLGHMTINGKSPEEILHPTAKNSPGSEQMQTNDSHTPSGPRQ